MIRYKLDIQPEPALKKINYRDKVMLMGSCFSEHIARSLSRLNFDVPAQPLGIVFNPISLAKPFKLMDDKGAYVENDLVSNLDTWYSKFHHGVFSGRDKTGLLGGINKAQSEFESGIRDAGFLFVTFGSAWVYRLKESHEIVANCHKIPQTHFAKELLGVDEIVKVWTEVLNGLKLLNPQLRVVFTVSPVKHLRDGVVENTVSKSILVVAIHRLRELHPDAGYFPAYELINDDLRDYRFYEQDGAHPNQLAIEYVFEKFRETYMDSEALGFSRDMEKYLQLKSHRTSRQEGPEYEQYLQHLTDLKKEVSAKYGVSL